MKLQNLVENKQFDFKGTFKNFSSTAARTPGFDDAIALIGYLPEEYKLQPKFTDTKGEAIFDFSNGLVDFSFYFGEQGQDSVEVGVYVAVNEKYLSEAQLNDVRVHSKFASLSNQFELEATFEQNNATELESFKVFIQNHLAIAEQFSEWYFDLTGGLGKKVLLEKSHTRIDGSNKIQVWVPVCGFFYASGTEKEATALTGFIKD